MKRIILIAINLLPLAGVAQKNYTIHGQVADAGNSATAYLRYMSNSGSTT